MRHVVWADRHERFSVLQKNFWFFQRNSSDKALIPFVGVSLTIVEDGQIALAKMPV